MGDATPAWEVDNYNTALQQALEWAKKMEQISNTDHGNVWRIADSDGYKRIYHVGKARISVTVSGSKVFETDCGGNASYSKNGTYTTDNAMDAKLQSSDKDILGSGWEWTTGKQASVNGSHTTDPETGVVTGHSSYSGWKGSKDGASGARKYVITVTFTKGKINAVNYDGNGSGKTHAGSECEDVGGILPAHALCGPCCRHDLPSVEDTWSQKLNFDTIKFTNVRVWKIEYGYVDEMTEIQKGTAWAEDMGTDDPEYDRILATITQSDPNIFFNIADENTSRSGRIRYSLQTGQDDAVTWFETYKDAYNGDGTILHRSPKCDGVQHDILPESNPVVLEPRGHEQTWCKGILYNNKTYFLILQTSSGDQSIMYHQHSVSSTTQKDFEDDLVFEDKDEGWSTMWENNDLVRKDVILGVGSYNGNYDHPDKTDDEAKYKGTSGGEEIPTVFDNDGNCFCSGIKDEENKAKVFPARYIQHSDNPNLSCPGHNGTNYAGQARLDRVNGLIIKKQPVIQCPINENKEYFTGQSYTFWRNILSYDNVGEDEPYENDFVYEIEDEENEELAEIVGIENCSGKEGMPDVLASLMQPE